MAYVRGTLRSLLEMPLKSAPPMVKVNLSTLTVQHNQDINEFTINCGQGGGKAVLNYEYLANDLVELYHTEVPVTCRGQGVAKLLAQAAFKFVIENNLRAKVTCTYLQRVLSKNPDRDFLKQVVS
ncbi:protein NATD1-like [Panonychus citri]|uniref:protein NATD1-like n=1 Tax=Panonychus citri TaxID=50023 RepID=UPI002307B4C6|nr:protein NATD1-like [Panonychus citri]XP_053209764.1 protein NATD1-like [Panonychus citri]